MGEQTIMATPYNAQGYWAPDYRFPGYTPATYIPGAPWFPPADLGERPPADLGEQSPAELGELPPEHGEIERALAVVTQDMRDYYGDPGLTPGEALTRLRRENGAGEVDHWGEGDVDPELAGAYRWVVTAEAAEADAAIALASAEVAAAARSARRAGDEDVVGVVVVEDVRAACDEDGGF